jgi:hypothetical protein
MLHASELFEEAGRDFSRIGIKVGQPALDLAAMMKFKDYPVHHIGDAKPPLPASGLR